MGKVLVAYFSASGVTAELSKRLPDVSGNRLKNKNTGVTEYGSEL